METTHEGNISSVITEYLEVVKLARSQNTALTYGKALKEFRKVLVKSKIDPETSPASALKEDMISRFVMHLKSFSPATEQVYVRAVARFYKYLAAERLAEINLPRMDLLIEQRIRKPGIRLPQFPTNEIEQVLDFVSDA
ncbi:MAG TPA: site-specific integrase, partial [Anaerolineales bacterium]|nr:site-specific integrase [Anaerolineales bacterium]